MKSVQIVAPGHIHAVWPTVRGLLNTAIINYEHADYDVEHLKVLLVKEFQILFVVVAPGEACRSLSFSYQSFITPTLI